MKRLPQKLAAVLLLGATFTFTSGQAHAGGWVPQIAGTWEIVGTPDEGGCGPSDPFLNIGTITLFGDLMNVDPDVGTALGEVYRTGFNRYAVGFFGFLPNPDPEGPALRYEVQGTAKRVNPGEFVGKFRTILSDPLGNPFCIYEGTIAGTRLVPMPY